VIDFEIEETLRPHFEFNNHRTLFTELAIAKMTKQSVGIVGPVGMCKSYSSAFFSKHAEYGKETYLVTCEGTFSAKSFMQALCRSVGVSDIGSRTEMLRRVTKKLEKDTQPQVIIDESENLPNAAFKAVKDMWDALEDICSIALIGSPEVEEKLYKGYQRDRAPFAQVYSRFAGCDGFKQLDAFSKEDVQLVCEWLNIKHKKIEDLLFHRHRDLRGLRNSIKSLKMKAKLKKQDFDYVFIKENLS
jgi:DNA transposition AAA+ family ATPase